MPSGNACAYLSDLVSNFENIFGIYAYLQLGRAVFTRKYVYIHDVYLRGVNVNTKPARFYSIQHRRAYQALSI